MQYSGEENLEVMQYADNYNNLLLKKIVNTMPSSANNIVDFGAGNGCFAKKISKQYNKHIICIEPAHNMHHHLKGFMLHNSLQDLSDKSQDFIYSLNVLEHIEDDTFVLAEMHQKLKRHGRIFIYVPAFMLLYSAMDKKVGHYRRYSKKELMSKVSQAGFDIVDCRYADFAGFFATLFFKLFSRSCGNLNIRHLKFYDKFIFPFSRLLDCLTQGKLLGKNICLQAIKK